MEIHRFSPLRCITFSIRILPVSYTHLDVYKRQGEQAKVKMCLLTLTPCNFLILDEPTNHLDIQAKESLKTALCNFPGTVLLVSHEEAFYRDWTQRVIHIEKPAL